MPKNDRPTLESIKFSLEVKERQNQFEIIKGVRRVGPHGFVHISKAIQRIIPSKVQ